MSIKVVIADDHVIVRDGIRAVIENMGEGIDIIGEASNGKELLETSEMNPPDVYILDISMPILNGLETMDRLMKRNPKSKVIILSMHDDKTLVEKSLKSGAKGYLLKKNSAGEMIDAIREVNTGKFFLSPDISRYVVQGFLGKDSEEKHSFGTPGLTTREREVLQLIAEGFTNKDMAKELNLSVNTVNFHRKNMMKKLDIHNQADLVRYALKEGIAEL
jgi:DNA-binding NarL/FixJ family response regulator